MSTNYYFRPTSGQLARFQLHIGKQAGGWEFMFQGYRVAATVENLDSLSGLTIEIEIPAFTLESHIDWLKFLRETPGVIKDEYEDELSLADFEAIIEALSPGKTWGPDMRPLQNHYDMLVRDEHRYGKIDPTRDWKDARGFSFSSSSFS